MTKKLVSILIVSILVLFAVSGCSGRTDDPIKEIESIKQVETEELTSGTTGPDIPEPVNEGDATPAVWRVTDGERSLYLFGTIHVGEERNDGALAAVRNLFDRCDALAVEFDTKAFENNLAASVDEITQFLYTDGTTVRDHLPQELYEKSLEIIQSGGDYSPLMERYNLAIWDQMMEQALIKPSGLSPEFGMDGLLLDRAYDNGKEILEVESAHFQYGLINEFPEELYVLLIEETLEEGEDVYCDELNVMYEAWLGGDMDTLEEYVIGTEEEEEELTAEQIEMLENYDYRMLEERNLGMAEKADSYLKSGKTVFFAVGAAHMLGDAGLVKLLTDKGYSVTRVEPPFLPADNA